MKLKENMYVEIKTRIKIKSCLKWTIGNRVLEKGYLIYRIF